jgi:hypothetical protein
LRMASTVESDAGMCVLLWWVAMDWDCRYLCESAPAVTSQTTSVD